MIKTKQEPKLKEATALTKHLMKQGNTFTDSLSKELISVRQMIELLRENKDTTTKQIANWAFTKLTDLLCMTLQMRSTIGDPWKVWYETQDKRDFIFREELDKIASQYGIAARIKKFWFHLSVSEAIPKMVHSDPVILTHILFVWLDNVSHFSTAASSVKMLVNIDWPGYITIKITDTAGSLKREDIEQLFNENRQSEQQRVTHSHGLYICQKMAECMGCKIEISPSADGLIFCLHIPY